MGSNNLTRFETSALVLPIRPNMITEGPDITLIHRLGIMDSAYFGRTLLP